MSDSALPAPPRGPAAGWIVSPAFDLAFLANIGWPVLLLPGLLRNDGRLETEFWQIYFLTTPHRWITLVLVAADPDRREGRGRFFAGLAVFAAVLVGAVWIGTGALTCLLLVDYLWNAWHFASQHFGVVRMYAKSAGGGPAWLERHGLRSFILYTLLRTAGWTTGWLESDAERRQWLTIIDSLFLLVPIAVVAANLAGMHRGRMAKMAYLTSLLSLYSGLLLALRNDWATGVFALTAASSTFHAVEYLAVVAHYMRRRQATGSDGAFRRLAKSWAVLILAYAIVLGLIGMGLGESGQPVVQAWLALNVWAALLHYSYDGFIWKLRRPATAAALGVPA
jgi:hypothetical protein